jgi:hypothetical protein
MDVEGGLVTSRSLPLCRPSFPAERLSQAALGEALLEPSRQPSPGILQGRVNALETQSAFSKHSYANYE